MKLQQAIYVDPELKAAMDNLLDAAKVDRGRRHSIMYGRFSAMYLDPNFYVRVIKRKGQPMRYEVGEPALTGTQNLAALTKKYDIALTAIQSLLSDVI
jgi:hypothetical protein